MFEVIDLLEPMTKCGICGCETSIYWWLPMWCNFIVPENMDIDWAGIPVCKHCFENPPKERVLQNVG